ncbi:MAG: glycosyltransferase [Ignavibacteriales bacterium]|nr:MAG: glycosyltransferase [Ignavibacteriales bacterium]
MSNNHLLKFSIIIAAHNEEKTMASLFESLKKLNYPKENYEIIFVNDQSTDNTKSVIDEFIQTNPNAKLFDSLGKKHPGKKGALDIGIAHAKNDFILITDADCEPEPNWLIRYSEKFSKGYDFLFGISPYKQTGSFVNKVATFENLRSHILTFTAARFGFPYSAAARSFGFHKIAFEKLDGYSKTLQTLCGDDDLLIREAVKNKMKIGTVEYPDAFVYSKTKENWNDYLIQKARHTSTSNYYLLKHQIFLAVWHLINLILLFSFIGGFFNPTFFIPFALKMGFDVLLIQISQSKFGYRFTIIEAFYLQIIYEFLLIVNYIRGTYGGTKWK